MKVEVSSTCDDAGPCPAGHGLARVAFVEKAAFGQPAGVTTDPVYNLRFLSVGMPSKHRHENFQNWEAVASEGGGAVAICEDGNGQRLFDKQIAWTDFRPPASGSVFVSGWKSAPLNLIGLIRTITCGHGAHFLRLG
jgi:hypothetical protein